MQTPRAQIQNLIIRLLQDVGKAHPQALIYPLTVAAKSNVSARRAVANDIMAKMREHSNVIVDQAEMVSTELIRAAILWHEMWYDGLEEASKYYFADNNIPGMLEVLSPLHEMVERGPETLRETSFVQSFGHDLRIAREHLTKFSMHGDHTEIQQAWDIYYSVSSPFFWCMRKLTSRCSNGSASSSSCSPSLSSSMSRPDCSMSGISTSPCPVSTLILRTGCH